MSNNVQTNRESPFAQDRKQTNRLTIIPGGRLTFYRLFWPFSPKFPRLLVAHLVIERGQSGAPMPRSRKE